MISSAAASGSLDSPEKITEANPGPSKYSCPNDASLIRPASSSLRKSGDASEASASSRISVSAICWVVALPAAHDSLKPSSNSGTATAIFCSALAFTMCSGSGSKIRSTWYEGSAGFSILSHTCSTRSGSTFPAMHRTMLFRL